MRSLTLCSTAGALFSLVLALGCQPARKRDSALDRPQAEYAIAQLRAAYAAFNRGDIDAAVLFLDPQVEWIEPAEFPGGGTYHGVDESQRF